MTLEHINRVIDSELFDAPFVFGEYCDGHIAEFKGGDRTQCTKCGDNWFAYNTPKAHFPLARHDYAMRESDCLRVLNWLRLKYYVVVEWDEGGVTVKARESKFMPFWHEFSSGKCDALPVAACIVALQTCGFGGKHMTWPFSAYQGMSQEERRNLGIPTTGKEYDMDAVMLTDILKEHFVNAKFRISPFDEMLPWFETDNPWFYRIQIRVCGLEFSYDMPFQQWYETKDKHAFVHVVYSTIQDRLMTYITGQDVSIHKWKFK